MPTLEDLLTKVEAREDLTSVEASKAALAMAETAASVEWKERFLLALAEKGESPEEVAAFAQTFRELARDPGLGDAAREAIDIVGTGGDHSGSFNISTTVCFIVAAAGVPVLKHGNRSVTSKCGSADLLEAVGIPMDAPLEVLHESMRKLHFAFFFAPNWHPAFKEIVPVRKKLAAEGKRTIFNILGPLINPCRPGRQLLGVFSADWVKPLAGALEKLDVERGMVVHGMVSGDGVMDELTCSGLNRVAGVGKLGELDQTWAPEDFKLEPCAQSDLQGGDLERNLEILQSLLEGKAPKGLRHTVLWNAGAALWIAEKVRSLEEGIIHARGLLEGGAVAAWLERAAAFYKARGQTV